MKIEIKSWLTGSVLFEGDFSCIADCLKAAIKSSADLRYANLSSADLRYANLRYANLSSADLRYANLRYADLSYANLSCADLRSADLSCANLSCADLRSANLSYANLSCADLRYAKNAELAIAMTRILPAGSLIGWKKCNGGIIAKLRIPEDAKRSHAFGRKCRAEFVEVLELWDGKKAIKEAGSDRGGIYIVGQVTKPDAWNEDYTNECSQGIHFFITREEAEAYTA